MKALQLIVFPFAVVLLCVSCEQKKSASDNSEAKPERPIYIELSGSTGYKNTLPYTLNDIVTDIRYIPLETKPECLIGRNVILPKFTKDYIFIASMGVLLQFDKEGKFIRKINKQGKGPKECTVRSYAIDEEKELIHLFDYRNLHIFSFEGQYIKTLRNPFAGVTDISGADFFVCEKETGNLIFADFEDGKGNEPYKYIVIDTAGIILYKAPNYTQYHLKEPSMIWTSIVSATGSSTRMYQYNSSYYYQYEYNDTIFAINNNYTCSPVYIRNLPNRLTIEDHVKMRNRVIKNEELYGKNSYSRCREDRRYLYLFHGHTISREEGFALLSLYEKSTGILIENINSSTPVLNDYDGGMDFPLMAYYPDEDQNVLILDPYKMKETLTEEHFAEREIANPDKSEVLKTLVSTMNEDDNPVLMIMIMK